METKDLITTTLSLIAICVAVASFTFTFRQRSVEDRRAARKALTDIVAEITKVNIAFAQLNLDHPGASDEGIISFRRSYNDQKRYLANHGTFLADQFPDLLTDIDCAVLGAAFASHGDYEQAERFHKLAVERSVSNTVKLNSMRSLARYYFRRGNPAMGRRVFEESLQLDLPNNDSTRLFTADTYLLWARAESDSGFDSESIRAQTLSRDSAKLIGQKNMRIDMLSQLDSAFPTNK